jgi:hypothetical protein
METSAVGALICALGSESRSPDGFGQGRVEGGEPALARAHPLACLVHDGGDPARAPLPWMRVGEAA